MNFKKTAVCLCLLFLCSGSGGSAPSASRGAARERHAVKNPAAGARARSGKPQESSCKREFAPAMHPVHHFFADLKENVTARILQSYSNIWTIGGDSAFLLDAYEPVFSYRGGTGHRLNPYYYESFADYLQPLIDFHSQSMIVTGSLSEAGRLQKFLTERFKKTNFSVLRQHRNPHLLLRTGKAPNPLKQERLCILTAQKAPLGDLSSFSLLIDININERFQERIRNISQMLIASTGKRPEILFLARNSYDPEEAENMLRFINISSGLSFSKGRRQLPTSAKRRKMRKRLSQAQVRFKMSLAPRPLKAHVFEKADRSSRAFVHETRGWMGYDDAKELIQSKGFSSMEEFALWKESRERPDNFPKSPYHVYKRTGEWESLPVFLGYRREWMTYQEAHEYILSLNLPNRAAFKEWSSSDKRPAAFPKQPDEVYRRKGNWRGWRAFLGYRPAVSNNIMMTYQEAHEYILSLNLPNREAFKKWSLSKERPENFPKKPAHVYSQTGEWESWSVFLGYKREYMTYQEAHEYILSLNLPNREAFKKWSLSKERPENFPMHPDRFYAELFPGYEIFLGYKKALPMSYQEAKAYIQQFQLKSAGEFRQWLKTYLERPANFRTNPDKVYQKTGEWEGWPAFLGYRQAKKGA